MKSISIFRIVADGADVVLLDETKPLVFLAEEKQQIGLIIIQFVLTKLLACQCLLKSQYSGLLIDFRVTKRV